MSYGQVNADVIGTSVAGSNIGAGNASILKNRIINGSMVIDQRNAGASVTPVTNQYTLDRWNSYQTPTGKYSVQQNAGSVTPPVGFTKYLGVTSLSAYSVAAGNLYTIMQYIEGYNVADLAWGTASAKTVTLSFQVYSSLTGTFGGSLTNGNQDRSYPFTYTVSSANTWTTVSVTIAGPTTGTWDTTTGNGISVFFGLGVGSTYSGTAGSWANAAYFSATGATSVVGTNGATFYITGVQLEVGSSATGFEYRQYTTELQLCQRYYWRTAGSSGATGFNIVGTGYANTTSNIIISTPLAVSMRSIPTLTVGGTLNVLPASVGTNVTTSVAQYSGNNAVWSNWNVSSAALTLNGPIIVYTQNASTNYFDATAEL
jgi:hypothetical protein